MTNAGLFAKDGAAVPLCGVEVRGTVVGGHAHVLVRQRYRNAERAPVEAVYTFPLPADATLAGFAMSCEGRRIEGEVREREEAFRAYDDALVAGHGAALLEQERPNVFTASVGNLLPGEETLVEVEYVQRVRADEGALRWMLPTLVAPRYIPGVPTGDRTAHGEAAPTDRVPDADRITPRGQAQVGYGLALDLALDLGSDAVVESPSHAITVAREGDGRVRVTFAQREVALDRDVVVVARARAEGQQLASVAAHKAQGEPGVAALTVVPDLFALARTPAPQRVTFLIDTSGSMDGQSLPEAQAALRLCLRHLREGDRFNVIAFESSFKSFAPEPVPFTQATLAGADAWVNALHARGGTELLKPLREAVRASPDGVLVLLTDGQVGNEQEILEAVLAARGKARVYSFGIGTNVSDALLRDLARQTGGAVEFIHPGERIDEKVVAQFARAVAPRVEGLTVKFAGVDLGELAPQEHGALVDGEPWTLFARYEHAGRGRAELRGTVGGEPFYLEVPVELPDAQARPLLEKLWAAERIRDLEATALSGRRAEAMRERIVKLAVKHGVASQYTSFVVVEKRTGDRRATEAAQTRVVPVNLPAGWAMFDAKTWRPGMPVPQGYVVATKGSFTGASTTMIAPRAAFAPGGRAGAPGAMPPSPAVPAMPRAPAPAAAPRRPAPPPPPGLEARAEAKKAYAFTDGAAPAGAGGVARDRAFSADDLEIAKDASRASNDPLVALLERQLASGLWDEPAAAGDPTARTVRATARALFALLRAGVTTAHALYGAQVRKAVDALVLAAVAASAREPALAEFALAVCWLAASGRRTRGAVENAVASVAHLASLRARFADEPALRAHVDQRAAALALA